MGLPRAGKTTCIDQLKSRDPSMCVIKEDFSENPFNKLEKPHEYDLWICKNRIKILSELEMSSKKISVFDRGIIDRIVWAHAKFEFGITSKAEKETEIELLEKYTQKIDVSLLFDVSKDVSLQRAVPSDKLSITRDPTFLGILRKTYLIVSKKYGVHVIDASQSKEQVLKKIKGISPFLTSRTGFPR